MAARAHGVEMAAGCLEWRMPPWDTARAVGARAAALRITENHAISTNFLSRITGRQASVKVEIGSKLQFHVVGA